MKQVTKKGKWYTKKWKKRGRLSGLRSKALKSYRRVNIHRYKRTVVRYGGLATSPTDGTVLNTMIFQLNDLPNVSEYTSLYEYYKITYIVVNFIWRSSNMSIMETQNNVHKIGMPYMFYVVDRDSESAPNDIDDLREYSRVKRFDFSATNRTCRVAFKPNVVIDGIKTSSGSGQMLQFNKWLDCATTNVSHYGLKFGIQTPFSGTSESLTQNIFDVEVKYYLVMKDSQ